MAALKKSKCLVPELWLAVAHISTQERDSLQFTLLWPAEQLISPCQPPLSLHCTSLQGPGPLPFHLGVFVTQHQRPHFDQRWPCKGARGTWVEGEWR